MVILLSTKGRETLMKTFRSSFLVAATRKILTRKVSRMTGTMMSSLPTISYRRGPPTPTGSYSTQGPPWVCSVTLSY